MLLFLVWLFVVLSLIRCPVINFAIDLVFFFSVDCFIMLLFLLGFVVDNVVRCAARLLDRNFVVGGIDEVIKIPFVDSVH